MLTKKEALRRVVLDVVIDSAFLLFLFICLGSFWTLFWAFWAGKFAQSLSVEYRNSPC